MMKKNIVAMQDVSKSFRRQKALDHVSLSIPEQCVYGLLGPNGAGKSTLLKILTGILRPDGGTVSFQGHEWSRTDLAEIGALVETPPIYENLSAWENLKVRALILGIPDSRIAEVLKLTGLGGTGKKKAGAFSLGMKQRLGIAVALLNHPKFLVLDEPVNGLDPLGIQELRELIRSFPGQGITVLVSSHILSEIEQVADYVGIIVNGRLEYESPLCEAENAGWEKRQGQSGAGQSDLEALFMDIVERQQREGIR
jgi:ABC-2 type transport system ATP-binding protein